MCKGSRMRHSWKRKLTSAVVWGVALLTTGTAAMAEGRNGLVEPYLAMELGVGSGEVAEVGQRTSPGRLISGGLLGGSAGFAIGGAASLLPAREDCPDRGEDEALCTGLWIFGGGSLVGAFGMPLGVHIANHRQGKLLPAVLAPPAPPVVPPWLAPWPPWASGADIASSPHAIPHASNSPTMIRRPDML